MTAVGAVHHMFLGFIGMLLAVLHWVNDAQGASVRIRSHIDVTSAVYSSEQPASGCVRLLNASGVIGCSGSNTALHSQSTKTTLIGWSDFATKNPPGKHAYTIVVEPAHLAEVLASLPTNTDTKGVLVLPGPIPSKDSDADVFPLADLAPYEPGNHSWNPNGTGNIWRKFDIPVIQLSNEAASRASTGAVANAIQGWEGAIHFAELQSKMLADDNSHACLTAGTCLPLGSHSVLAFWPPLQPHSDSEGHLPITVVIAQMDSSSMFHETSVGAEAPLSGLLAMLAAAQTLAAGYKSSMPYRRRLAFVAVSGDTWGGMGSRRLLWELHTGAASVKGIHMSDIDQVIEIGQVGRAKLSASSNRPQLYIHQQQPGTGFGDPASMIDVLKAQETSQDRPLPKHLQAEVMIASSRNPGVPPSSLFTWLRVRPSIRGVMVADFDEVFENPFFESRFDNVTNVDIDRITAAAIATANALSALVAGAPGPQLQINPRAVNQTVSQLSDCLLASNMGMTCALARDLITASGAPLQHYIGVLNTLTSDPQDPDPAVKSDLPRFLWNFLANATAVSQGPYSNETSCDFGRHKCPDSYACTGHKSSDGWPADAGVCLQASVRYVPSYSTLLSCRECGGDDTFYDSRWQVTDEANEWAKASGLPPDPLWTESFWPDGMPSYTLYQAEDPQVVQAVWICGVIATCATLTAALVTQLIYK